MSRTDASDVIGLVAASALLVAAVACDQGARAPGSAEAAEILESYPWANGIDCSAAEPDVVEIGDDTVVFRQPLCDTFEGPFLYLLFGAQRALLLDSGDRRSNMAPAVLAKVDAYKKRHGLTSYELIVAYTHSHGDHVGGASYFAGNPGVKVLKYGKGDAARFFGLDEQRTGCTVRQWPQTAATLDLGGRVLDVLPLPGHQEAHILVYDPKQRLLFTGDTLYPGRLYIEDWDAYRASAARLASFVSSHDVRYILGAHIELRRDKAPDGKAIDYAMGEDKHPGEHTLALAPDEATKLAEIVDAQGDSPQREASQNFILVPVP